MKNIVARIKKEEIRLIPKYINIEEFDCFEREETHSFVIERAIIQGKEMESSLCYEIKFRKGKNGVKSIFRESEKIHTF